MHCHPAPHYLDGSLTVPRYGQSGGGGGSLCSLLLNISGLEAKHYGRALGGRTVYVIYITMQDCPKNSRVAFTMNQGEAAVSGNQMDIASNTAVAPTKTVKRRLKQQAVDILEGNETNVLRLV